MIFTKDDIVQKIFATIPGIQGNEVYECLFNMCSNPLCTCSSVTIQFVPYPLSSEQVIPALDKRITLNVESKQVDIGTDPVNAHETETDFQQTVRALLQDDDYQFLAQEHFLYKRDITTHADISSLHANFSIDDIERNTTMLGYTDVLPYGEYFTLTLETHQYMLFDQYCVKPHCSCVDAVVSCVLLNEQGHGGEDVAAYTINYKKRRWERVEQIPPVSGAIGQVGVIKRATEAIYPAFYHRLQARHTHLKILYANCLKEKGIGLPRLSTRSVGRNAPCPCGSGKKYKKCCLNKAP